VTEHDAYLAACAPEPRRRLEAIRAEAEKSVPGAERCIAYKMPALRGVGRKGKVFFYFAAFKHHIGIYPPVPKGSELDAELAPYRGPKGNLSFPYKDPLPVELIGRVAEALATAYARP
jgi:uncharacterized protein YdhG (YjbR/CyaY superfamily)